jgi:murein DD-endopeptidase MepM/ murein hydrolase activator NlpD
LSYPLGVTRSPARQRFRAGVEPKDLVTALAARFAHSSRRAERPRVVVELGHEPAIQLEGPRTESRERRLPVRWLFGVALTGLSGVALIGSALYLDLDRQSNFAQPPELAAPPRKDSAQSGSVNSGKGDRLVRPVDIVAAKQSFKSPIAMKIGDKEVVKARPFTLLSTTLTTTPTGFADVVPPFDPLKAINASAGKGEAPLEAGPAPDDSEVAFSSRDISAADAAVVKGELTLNEAQAQVVEAIKAQSTGEHSPWLAPQALLMRTSRAAANPLGALSYATTGNVGAAAPFTSIEVRMVPENVTNIPKSPLESHGGTGERLVQVRHGETFEDLLRANGAGKDAIPAIMSAFGLKAGESPVADGQRIILQYDEPPAPDKPPTIARVSIYSEEQLKSEVAINDADAYVRMPVRRAEASAKRSKPEADEGGMSLYESFYQTALKQGLAKPLIDEMVRAFANDVDFQRSVQLGDSLAAFIEDPDEYEPHPQLLFATMTVREQTFRYYRFQTPDDNLVDYYDENGRSVRKFLIRKPIVDGEMTSGFGMRFHPILRYAKMHTGVDWAGPVGTPILAAGNGVVIEAELTSGYGRRVEIQHANGYVTTYNHMSGFARGIVPGVRVTQGQVIGYLGQSGLATGPHLHYEVVINGNFVDPMAIKLARTREFDGKMLAAFKHERERIDQLMAQAPSASASASVAPPLQAAKVN